MVRMTQRPTAAGNFATRMLAVAVFVAALLVAGNTSFAQLSGSYSVGPTGTYSDIADAVNALSSQGVSGPVTFNVQAGTYTGSINISAVTGASSTNTITFQGTDASTRIIEANTSSATSYVIRMNGADYIRFRNFTIKANGSTYGYGVHFTSNADYNEITDCIIEGSSTTTSSYAIGVLGSGSNYYYSYGNTGDYNLIEDCEISGFYYGVRWQGSSSSTMNVGNQFIGNEITGFYYYGFYLYYLEELEVTDNVIMSRTNDNSYGIRMYSCDEGAQIERNKITVGRYGVYSYYTNNSNDDQASISSNMIAIYGSSTNYGIYIRYNYNVDIDYNSINTVTNSTAYGVYAYYAYDNINFRNNNIQHEGSGTAYLVYYYPSSYATTSRLLSFDYNNFYRKQGGTYYWYFRGFRTSISSLKGAHSSYNTYAYTYDPEFISSTDLHTYSQNLNGAATPISGQTMDADGDTRDGSTPDIGADEYTLYPTDVGAVTLIAPVEGCGLGANEDVIIGIRNYGTTTLDAGSNPVTVNVDIVTPNGPMNYMATKTSGTIAPGATSAFTVTGSLDLSTSGPYTFNATATCPGDGNSSNNDMKETDMFVDETIDNFPYFQNFEANAGNWRGVSVNGGLNSWEWGDPNFQGTAYYAEPIQNANSGINCWMTGLTSGYQNGENSALQSPCLDFTNLNAPVLQFYMKVNTYGYYGGMIVEASSNGGQSWSKLYPYYPSYYWNYFYYYGPLATPYYGHYDHDDWEKAVFLLGAYANKSNVKVRFHMGNGGYGGNGYYTGVAVDDIAIGDFYQKDISVAEMWQDNAQGFFARKDAKDHTIHAHVFNVGYEKNPKNVTLTYKAGSMPTSTADGTTETFTMNWQGSEAMVTFSAPHVPAGTGDTPIYVRAFYSGDQGTTNDVAMKSHDIWGPDVYGWDDYDNLTPPELEKGWTIDDVNGGNTFGTTAGNGMAGSTALTYPGDVVDADDIVYTPAADLLAGSSYSIDLKYRSRTGAPQTFEVWFGPSADINSMQHVMTVSNLTNTSFQDLTGQYGVAPFFNTPNVAQPYYLAIRVTSPAGSGALDFDMLKLYDNPFPPPKIAYREDGLGNPIDDPLIPLKFTGVYKKTGLLTKHFQIVSSTGWYGTPEGDMLWEATTPNTWIQLTMPTPDPLTYLTVNPYTPEWARQRQFLQIDANGITLPAGQNYGQIDIDAELYNATYDRGIKASNSIFSIPVEFFLSAAGGPGGGGQTTSGNASGLTSAGNPHLIYDQFNTLIAVVNVKSGNIPNFSITSYPGQLPQHRARYRLVYHMWEIQADGAGWVADVDFMYYDGEVLAGGVTNEAMLRGMRIPAGTAMWEDPIMGTTSTPNVIDNVVTVHGITPSNYDGQIVVGHDWFVSPKLGLGNVPSVVMLDQNYPNPFNPSTTIEYGVPEETHVELVVLNTMGEEVATIVDDVMPAGYHEVSFDASDLASGMYIYRLRAGDVTQTKTMIVNK